jgi:hypothetical protein
LFTISSLEKRWRNGEQPYSQVVHRRFDNRLEQFARFVDYPASQWKTPYNMKTVSKVCIWYFLFAAISSVQLVAQHWIRDTAFAPYIDFSRTHIASAAGAAADLSQCSFFPGPEGTVYLKGPFSGINGSDRLYLARFLASGKLDTSYIPQLPSGTSGVPVVMAGSADGSLLLSCSVVEYTSGLSTTQEQLVLLDASGALKASLNASDVGVPLPVSALAMDASGRVLIAYFTPDAKTADNFRLAWLNLETKALEVLPCRFGGMTLPVICTSAPLEGTAIVGPTLVSATLVNPVRKVVVLDDGRVLLSGDFTTIDGVLCSSGGFGFARLSNSGALDPSFAPDLNVFSNWRLEGIDSTGRILASALRRTDAGVYLRYYLRLQNNGAIDAYIPAPGDLSFRGLSYSNDGTTANVMQTPVRAGNVAFTTQPLARWVANPSDYLEIISGASAPVEGSDLILSAVSANDKVLSCRWSKDGALVSEGADPFLSFVPLRSTDVGLYTTLVKYADGSERSTSYNLATTASTTRIRAFSSRGSVRPGREMITGIVLDKSGMGDLAVFSIGRGLNGAVKKTDLLGDNRLNAYRFNTPPSSGSILLAQDEGGMFRSEVSGLASLLGLHVEGLWVVIFGTNTNMGSAVLVKQADAGSYSFVSESRNGASGVCFAEAYLNESTSTLSKGYKACSVRGRTGAGGDVMIAGFTVEGNSQVTVLIRGLGPSLTASGVANASTDPNIEVHSGSAQTVAASNDDWAGDTAVAAAMKSLGMAAWDSKSKESALLLRLSPGVYTVLLRDVSNTDSEAMIEVYVVE